MQTKLTLRMDEEAIAQAKAVAQAQGKSVSQLVADYFVVLGEAQQPRGKQTDAALPEITKGLRGLLKQAEQADLDEADYKQHLLDKHL